MTGTYGTCATANGMRWAEYGPVHSHHLRRSLFVSNESTRRINQEEITRFYENWYLRASSSYSKIDEFK